MAYKLHHWISEMYHALFHGLPDCLNADCHPPSFKLNQVDGKFCLEQLLFIPGDAITLSLQLVSDALCISEAPDYGFCLSIG
jgi:hypothetical protein